MWHLTKIPKIVHFYWGNEKLSYLRYLSILSFRKLNPDWRIKVHIPKQLSRISPTWISEEQKNLSIKEDYWDEVEKLGVEIIVQPPLEDFDNNAHEVHKSDFFRWKLLVAEGGVWSDIDIFYINPMNNLVENTVENSLCDTAFSWYAQQRKWAISFMLSSVGNPFYKKIHELSKTAYDKNRYQSIGSELINNNYHRPSKLSKQNPEISFVLMDQKGAYPIGPTEIENFYTPLTEQGRQLLRDPNVVGFHWFAGHPSSQKFESELNEKNVNTFDNILAEAIKNLQGK